MKDITELFSEIYTPKKALLFFRSEKQEGAAAIYVEAYDIDDNGRPMNAHPLQLSESAELANALAGSGDLKKNYLIPKGLLPENLLYLDQGEQGCAVWHTPSQKVKLLFREDLSIPSGEAYVPPLVWKATLCELSVFALKNDKKPTERTALYHAPFFNIHVKGTVCMGTVDVDTDTDCLEEFMFLWQQYFWNSYFSHLLTGFSPVTGNIIQLWQELIKTKNKFPVDVLKKSTVTIQNLIQ